tara:strand:+ start:552 stop:722 length:171 start_codon:yes stop_codon:yes gene_type:complete
MTKNITGAMYIYLKELMIEKNSFHIILFKANIKKQIVKIKLIDIFVIIFLLINFIL